MSVGVVVEKKLHRPVARSRVGRRRSGCMVCVTRHALNLTEITGNLRVDRSLPLLPLHAVFSRDNSRDIERPIAQPKPVSGYDTWLTSNVTCSMSRRLLPSSTDCQAAAVAAAADLLPRHPAHAYKDPQQTRIPQAPLPHTSTRSSLLYSTPHQFYTTAHTSSSCVSPRSHSPSSPPRSRAPPARSSPRPPRPPPPAPRSSPPGTTRSAPSPTRMRTSRGARERPTPSALSKERPAVSFRLLPRLPLSNGAASTFSSERSAPRKCCR